MLGWRPNFFIGSPAVIIGGGGGHFFCRCAVVVVLDVVVVIDERLFWTFIGLCGCCLNSWQLSPGSGGQNAPLPPPHYAFLFLDNHIIIIKKYNSQFQLIFFAIFSR